MHTSRQPAVSMPVAAEAAEWIARLHGPARSRQMDRDCLAWLSRSQAHRHAFERCTATWEDVRGVPCQAFTDSATAPSLRARRA